MKKSLSLFVVVALAAILLLAANPASADLIAYDNFESYPVGDLNGGAGGTGWGTNSWTGGAGDVTVASGVVPGYGKSMQITDVGDTSKLISRALDVAQTGTVYVGMLFRVGTLASDDFIQFYANDGGNENEGASMGAKSGTLFARVDGSGGTSNSSTNAVEDQTFQLVLKIEKETGGAHATNYDRARLFIDRPTEWTPGANVGADSGTATLSAFNVRTFGLETDDVVYADELRIATTYAEALTKWVALPTDADAYIKDNAATTNYGNSSQLQIKHSDNSSNNRKAYIRFDLSDPGIDLATDLADATLSLNFVDSGAGSTPGDKEWTFELFGLKNGHAKEGWVEGNGGTDNDPTGEITWSNAPANAAWNGLVTGEVTSLGTFSVEGKGLGEIDIASAALTQFLKDDTDGQVTFILRRTTQGSSSDNYVHAISSKESASGGPVLALTPVPEPSTLALAAIGLLGLRRKRR